MQDIQLALKATATACVAVGFLQCLFGYKIFKFVLALTGFLLGSVGLGLVLYRYTGNQYVAMGGGLAGGLLGGGLVVWLHHLGVFLMGGIMGTAFVLGWFALGANPPHHLVLLGVAAGCGLVALALKKFMLVVATSFAGAWGMVVGGAHLLKYWDLRLVKQVFQEPDTKVKLMLGAWILLGLIGLFFQFKLFPKREKVAGEEPRDARQSSSARRVAQPAAAAAAAQDEEYEDDDDDEDDEDEEEEL